MIWVRSGRCGCLVTWFCYQLIAKPGHKRASVLWPDPYDTAYTTAITWENLYQTWNSQKISHSSHSWVSYGESIVSIFEKIYTGLDCVVVMFFHINIFSTNIERCSGTILERLLTGICGSMLIAIKTCKQNASKKTSICYQVTLTEQLW